MKALPLYYEWTGEAFVPIARHAKQCDERFTVHEIYALEEVMERSEKSHRQYFAAIREGFLNLPHHLDQQFASPEALRKHCLIKAGFHDKRSILCASKAEAQRVAAFVKPMDEYTIVTVDAALVTVYTAQSQSFRAMGKATFQASKQAVLEIIADMIGAPVETLRQNAGEAA